MNIAAENHPREYLFLSTTAALGGIETLMTRMANALAKQGQRVTVVSPAGPMTKSYSASVEHIEMMPGDFAAKFTNIFRPHSDSEHISIWCSHPDILKYAFDCQATIHASYKLTSNSLSGIFHPDQIAFRGKVRRISDSVLFSILPTGSVYFMNDAVKQTALMRHGQKFSKWPVQKLAMHEPTAKWSPVANTPLRIVSVGRITSFKAYNFGAPLLVKLLRAEGIDCVWHIWGEGEALQEALEVARGSEHVVFHGELPYDEFLTEVVRHDIFVGMGTAALEAASCGMPTIVALVDSQTATYGYLFECPADSIGEIVDGVPTKTIHEVISSHIRMSLDERARIGETCRNSVPSRAHVGTDDLGSALGIGIHYPPSIENFARMTLVRSLSRMSKIFGPFGRAQKT